MKASEVFRWVRLRTNSYVVMVTKRDWLHKSDLVEADARKHKLSQRNQLKHTCTTGFDVAIITIRRQKHNRKKNMVVLGTAL